MGALPEERANQLAKRLAEKKLDIPKSEIEALDKNSGTNYHYTANEYFIKIEKYFNMRELISRDIAVQRQVDLNVETTEMVGSGYIDGYSYRVFKYVSGESLGKASEGKSFTELPKDKRVKKIRDIGRAMAKIHQSKSFDNFGRLNTMDGKLEEASAKKWSQGLEDIQFFWHRYAKGSKFERIRERVERFYSENQSLLDQINESVLIHQELGFHNIIFRDESLIVLDWESAGAGDPLLDVVTTEVILDYEGVKEEDRKELREAYKSVRELREDEELEDVYRVVELSRLFIVFKDDEEKLEDIKKQLGKII